VAQSFLSSLQTERIVRKLYCRYDQAVVNVFDYIELLSPGL
jgi:hypothetical protein